MAREYDDELSLMTGIADAIREKSGTEDKIASQDMPRAILNIESGGGTDFVPITKAEYDALGDATLDDNIPYLITDWTEGGGSGGDVLPDLAGTKEEFEAIKDTLPDGSAFDTIDEEVGGGSLANIFIDTSRILINNANLVDGSEYTATENCFIVIENRTNSNNDGHGFDVLIDNVIVFRPYSRNTANIYMSRPINFYMKKGQTFKIVVNDKMPTNLTFKSFGLF